ncbi:GTPase Era [Anaeromassilibacillus senegalensis]|uniref:GTPase Era n=1 Tax=Anaeromassilibacillus senegalensis TaxID=1673717 RepID=UPI000681D613|nr:GTPase Era [Anaeromassilibacillus senegalensis]
MSELKNIEIRTDDKTAFVAIVGRPNVGKSSLLNRMLGQKVAIVSSKPQTTRTRIMGVLTEEAVQLVFIDTPGLMKPRNRLGDFMVRSVSESVSGVDACLLVVEAGQRISPADEELIKKFRSMDMPAVLAINKIDLLQDKTVLMAQIAALSAQYNFAAVVPVSAQTGDGMRDLVDELEKLAMPGGHFFDDDTLTDQPERVLAGEIVREKLLRLLDKEIPHGVAVAVERMREQDNGTTEIHATIFCERDSHKGIIIGKNGSMLKKVGTYARQDMEAFFGCKINLQLWVKVKEGWRDSEAVLRSLGYDSNSFDA